MPEPAPSKPLPPTRRSVRLPCGGRLTTGVPMLHVAVAGAGLSGPALACGRCVDARIALDVPFVAAWAALAALWWLATAAATRAPELAPGRPSRRRLWLALGLSIAVLAITRGSGAACLLAFGTTWVVQASFDFWRDRRRPAALRRVDRLCLGGALLASLLGLIERTSPQHLVRVLEAHTVESGPAVARRLIHVGPRAVPALLDALDTARLSGHDRDFGARLVVACYCLGRVGGAEAEQRLLDVVSNHVVGAEPHAWRRAACFALADAAGDGAVGSLIALYRALPADDRDRWSVLAALVRTGEFAGVAFAMENLGVLLEPDLVDRAAADGATSTVAAILDGRTRLDLLLVPGLLDATPVAGLERARTGRRESTPSLVAERLAGRWAAEQRVIQTRWANELGNAWRRAAPAGR